MRGEVLHYDDVSAGGLISGEDGNRYSFALSDFRRPVVPQQLMTVDFIVDGANAREIYPIAVTATAAPRAATPAPTIAIEPDRSLFAYFLRASTNYYANFNGRARRKEYWGFTLYYWLLFVILMVVITAGIANSHFSKDVSEVHISPLIYIGALLWGLVSLGFFIPSIAVTVRRLHDLEQSGWLLLLHFLPMIGSLILLVMMFIEGERQPNFYGPPVK
jgi:uncharacterized membrane protein YhaH (DUF805 family)